MPPRWHNEAVDARSEASSGQSMALNEVEEQQHQQTDPEGRPGKLPRLSFFAPSHTKNIRLADGATIVQCNW